MTSQLSSFHLLTTILTTILMTLPATTIITGDRTTIDYTKIDSYLQKEIDLRQPDDDIEIIAQFRSEVTKEDLRTMERFGIEAIYVFHAIPAVYAKGTVESVLQLSSYPRTFWLEYNMENELALQETTTVIKATTPWTSDVKMGKNSYTEFQLNPQSKLVGLDGTGVTVAIVDTGVDGQHPDLDYGEKLIMNKHKNGPNDPWVEMENSDTSYGHGTHCAGIVGGNGDASGGRRRGVAPGASLIGVGGDWTPVYWVVLEGLEWVYDNSKPGSNPHNIRVISNSWGGAGDYDPQDAITVICNKLTYENNVLCVFAGMNSGDGNHDGHADTTSQQSKVPSILSVAAATHDGEGMANFSSRGKKGDWYTYPDITAPGVDIWATRPRYTWLGEYQLVDEDMYYMAISGTSMATPHVSGLAAIMFQAAPSLRTSNHHEDDNSPEGTWGAGHDPRIHEVEYILKMTSDMIPSTSTPDNGIPDESERDKGLGGREFDYAQGYGLVNSEKAVAVALTLEKMREDNPKASVDDALEQYETVLGSEEFIDITDTLTTSWRGEWAQLINGSNPLSSTTFSTDQSHRVYIPEEASFLEFDLIYNPLDLNLATGGRIDLTLDWDGDGESDIQPQFFDFDGTKHYEVDIEAEAPDHRGRYWTFNVEGEGLKFAPRNQDDEFHEALIEYNVELSLRMEPSTNIILDATEYATETSPWRFGESSSDFSGGTITLKKNVFDVSEAEYKEDDGNFLEDLDMDYVPSLLLLTVGLGAAAAYLFFKRRDNEIL